MKDKFNREIDYLRISVTDRCNLRCLYCMPEGIVKKDKEEIIQDDEIIDIVTESVKIGIKKVRITGGEPLVRRGIYELIKKIDNVEGIEEIVVTTNGIGLLNNVKKLKDCGVSRVNISLDTLNKEKYKKVVNVNVEFPYEALIKELRKFDMLPVKVNVVLLKGINDEEIIDFYNFADEFDVQVRFIELMPFDSPQFKYDDYYISKDDILNRHKNLKFSRKSNNVEFYKIEGKETEIGFINAISAKFCEACNRLRLTSDGYLKPCLHSNSEIYVKDKSKEEIMTELKRAIKQKPKQHSLDKEYVDSSKRSMNKIGG